MYKSLEEGGEKAHEIVEKIARTTTARHATAAAKGVPTVFTTRRSFASMGARITAPIEPSDQVELMVCRMLVVPGGFEFF